MLTSFPKELFEAYKQAFEQKYPGVKVIVKQQQTNQAVTYLRETRAKPEADIVWVSAVDVFQTLKGDGLLDRIVLPKELLARIPAKIGGFSLHDPDGQYLGFAVSGYGLMWNTRYLALHKLPPQRVDGSHRSALPRTPVDLGALAERHHAPDSRGDPAGLRLGKGVGAPDANGRQHGSHRGAELRRAGGRHLRAAR